MNTSKKDQLQSNDVTKEQLSDVYAAGSSDGLMKTDEGIIHIREDGSVEERSAKNSD